MYHWNNCSCLLRQNFIMQPLLRSVIWVITLDIGQVVPKGDLISIVLLIVTVKSYALIGNTDTYSFQIYYHTECAAPISGSVDRNNIFNTELFEALCILTIKSV